MASSVSMGEVRVEGLGKRLEDSAGGVGAAQARAEVRGRLKREGRSDG